MTYSRENHLENLEPWYEFDQPDAELRDAELEAIAAREKLILCDDQDPENQVLENCSYIYVDPSYQGALTAAQRQLYEILLTLQTAGVYTVTTIGKLSKAQGLDDPYACIHRLNNLQSLDAISGYRR